MNKVKTNPAYLTLEHSIKHMIRGVLRCVLRYFPRFKEGVPDHKIYPRCLAGIKNNVAGEMLRCPQLFAFFSERSWDGHVKAYRGRLSASLCLCS